VLTLPPNRRREARHAGFGGIYPAPFTVRPKLLGTAARLLMAAAPLPGILRIAEAAPLSLLLT